MTKNAVSQQSTYLQNAEKSAILPESKKNNKQTGFKA